MTDAELLSIARARGATISPSFAERMAEAKAEKKQPKFQERRADDKFKSKAEREYAAHLDQLKADGQIFRWEYEAIALRIDDGKGKSLVFWPDFAVWITPGGMIRFDEVKGRGKFALRPVARAKLLAARRIYPEFTFCCLVAPDWEEIL